MELFQFMITMIMMLSWAKIFITQTFQALSFQQ